MDTCCPCFKELLEGVKASFCLLWACLES
jgi:hypothetical protein